MPSSFSVPCQRIWLTAFRPSATSLQFVYERDALRAVSNPRLYPATFSAGG